jgi:hypothetical protein
MTADIRGFQIFYDDKTRAMIDPDFEPLDNSAAERPDWYEYWPIRKYLAGTRLERAAYYGFLSPMFFEKTRLTGRQVRDFLAGSGDADVVTFSSFPCQGACFINVFEQGEFFHRGLIDAASRFFREVAPGTRVEDLVTHSRNTVFSNFFFAKPRFWALWSGILDRLFDFSENPESALCTALRSTVDYRRGDGVKQATQMKIFVMERAVTFLLATTPSFTVRNFPPFQMPITPGFRYLVDEIRRLDALKLAFAETGDPRTLELFRELQKPTIKVGWQRGPVP